MAFSSLGKLFHFKTSDFRGARTESGGLLLDIFERSRAGNFSSSSMFPSIFELSPSIDTAISAFTLMPYVTPGSTLLEIASPIRLSLRDDGQMLEWLCIALTKSGLLRPIELAVAIYQQGPSNFADSDLPYQLSIALESSVSDIFYGPRMVPGTIDEFDPDRAQYEVAEYTQLVMSRIDEIRKRYPSHASVSFLHGQPINLAETALNLLNSMAKAHDNEDVVVARDAIEAFTGFDLSDFYRKSQLDRIAAAAALERLFDEVDLYQFKPGVRHFFGKPIPD
ncbi:hypothetical protein [Mesorhizobium sp. J8]|uniref:hypothetical protein n=1 Tax=Mesorhizobium sp. J8 TaxID=2777475 RepID=UPI0019160244|nr:hypothetical protein [Mesorhizobium sp. J8]BCM17230.1 hypothetical protein MJ8_09930 [Mesorhizobium sp. J8]